MTQTKWSLFYRAVRKIPLTILHHSFHIFAVQLHICVEFTQTTCGRYFACHPWCSPLFSFLSIRYGKTKELLFHLFCRHNTSSAHLTARHGGCSIFWSYNLQFSTNGVLFVFEPCFIVTPKILHSAFLAYLLIYFLILFCIN